MIKEPAKYDKLDTARAITRLWEPLTAGQRTALLQIVKINSFTKNDIIYHEGDEPRDIHCILKGKVKVYKKGLMASNGRNQIMRVLKPVEFFGYRAFFAGDCYNTTTSAFEDCVIASIPLSFIEQLVLENNKVALLFIKDLAVDLGQADTRTLNLTQKHVRGRLAETLLFLRDSYGLEADQHTLSVYISREDVANLSNMTTANAIRTLSSFAKEKVISMDGKKIKIINENELEKISKLG